MPSPQRPPSSEAPTVSQTTAAEIGMTLDAATQASKRSFVSVVLSSPSPPMKSQKTELGASADGAILAQARTQLRTPSVSPQYPSTGSTNVPAARYSHLWRNHPSTSFTPGTIIRASLFEQDLPMPRGSADTSNNRFTFTTPNGRRGFVKDRLMVVVHAFSEHCVVAPVFSFSGNGLERKPESIKNEFLSILDHRTKDADKKSQNSHPVLLTEVMAEGVFPIMLKSVVRFTHPVSLKFGHSVVVAGRLTRDSTTLLTDYYYQHAGRPARHPSFSPPASPVSPQSLTRAT